MGQVRHIEQVHRALGRSRHQRVTGTCVDILREAGCSIASDQHRRSGLCDIHNCNTMIAVNHVDVVAGNGEIERISWQRKRGDRRWLCRIRPVEHLHPTHTGGDKCIATTEGDGFRVSVEALRGRIRE